MKRLSQTEEFRRIQAEAESPTPQQRHRVGVFQRDAALCALRHLGGCSGRLEADHVIEQQRLRNLLLDAHRFKNQDDPLNGVSLDALLADPRNGWLLCEHHHNLKTRRLIRLKRDDLPPSVERFAKAFRIEWSLSRDYGESEVAA